MNHVRVTEAGHIFEVDDSPNAERIHQYHTSGTFTEIQPNGTRVTKVVGDDYEIILHDKNMLVNGNVSITVNGADLRLYVKRDDNNIEKGGDMYIETDGDLNFNIKGDLNTKVGGTESKEVMTDQTVNIMRNKHLRVGGQETHKVHSNHSVINLGHFTNTTTGGTTFISGGGYSVVSDGSVHLHSDASFNITGLSTEIIGAASMKILGALPGGITIGESKLTTPTVKIIAAKIELN